MTSSINPTYPAAQDPTTQSVRDNFSSAKSEIEALQVTAALTANPLSQFAATTSAQLKSVISDETGSGALVFATSPSLVTPTLGVATATSVNGVTMSVGSGATAGSIAIAGALGSNSSGTSNVGIGTSALASNSTGDDNTAVGLFALYTNTAGNKNVCIGAGALGSNELSSENTAIGYSALNNGVPDSYCVAVGYEAGYGSSAQGITAVGYKAAYGAVTGFGNTMIGYAAGQSITSGANNTLIGNGATASAAGVSNEITLGNTSVTVLRTAAIPTFLNATAIPAGGTTGAGVKVSTTSNFGVFFGSGAPTLSAAKGSLYLRSDGSTTNDRMYVNTNGTTTWTAVTTAA